jgi:hypothetical protein
MKVKFDKIFRGRNEVSELKLYCTLAGIVESKRIFEVRAECYFCGKKVEIDMPMKNDLESYISLFFIHGFKNVNVFYEG